jgi:hypothetical protein
MSANPSVLHISGLGTPRLIRVLDRPTGTILTSSVANPTVITTPRAHGLVTGMTVRIAGHTGSTPAIDGDRLITVTGQTTFTIPLNVTVAGAGGTYEALTHIYESTGTTAFMATSATETGSPAFAAVKAGHRIASFRVVGALSYPTYAKVTAKVTGVLTVDAWSNGTPTAAQIFRIDGWICDLPRCQEMTETFEPDVLVKSIWKGDQGTEKEPKFRGWKYQCALDYRQYVSPDTLLDMNFHLGPKAKDQLILIPRADFPQAQYNVYFGAAIDLTRFGHSPGYKKPVFVFIGKQNLAGWIMVDGYGTAFATNYGTNY